jgi:hypothetical protein
MTKMSNKRHKPRVLCMNTHLPDASAAVTVLGWAVHPVNSVQEAIQAMHKRAYKAMVVSMVSRSLCPPLEDGTGEDTVLVPIDKT